MTANPNNTRTGTKNATRPMRPRDAATLIVMDASDGEPRFLMGRRRPDQVFMPDKYVFPGGRVDAKDKAIASADELRDTERVKLILEMKGSGTPEIRARALALAAIRETFEETGILIGKPAPTDTAPNEPSWAKFFAEGIAPSLGPLTFVARAITPPRRPRRYDTRFFLVDAREIAKTVDSTDHELRDLGWFTLDELRDLDIPNITRAITEDLAERLELGLPGPPEAPVPFYFFKRGAFERVLLG